MSRPIPGARFIACLFAGASLFGGATALADASLMGLTRFIAVPSSEPGAAHIDPASVGPSMKGTLTKAVAKPHRVPDGIGQDARPAHEDLGWPSAEGMTGVSTADIPTSVAPTPRLRPQPPRRDL